MKFSNSLSFPELEFLLGIVTDFLVLWEPCRGDCLPTLSLASCYMKSHHKHSMLDMHLMGMVYLPTYKS